MLMGLEDICLVKGGFNNQLIVVVNGDGKAVMMAAQL
jgi:hypothetical protein